MTFPRSFVLLLRASSIHRAGQQRKSKLPLVDSAHHMIHEIRICTHTHTTERFVLTLPGCTVFSRCHCRAAVIGSGYMKQSPIMVEACEVCQVFLINIPYIWPEISNGDWLLRTTSIVSYFATGFSRIGISDHRDHKSWSNGYWAAWRLFF